jgi:hypothetical protein
LPLRLLKLPSRLKPLLRLLPLLPLPRLKPPRLPLKPLPRLLLPLLLMPSRLLLTLLPRSNLLAATKTGLRPRFLLPEIFNPGFANQIRDQDSLRRPSPPGSPVP